MLLSLACEEGQSRLREAAAEASCQQGVVDSWRRQRNPTYCGLASLAIVLSSSGVLVDEDEVLGLASPGPSAVDEEKVRRCGLTLREVEAVAVGTTSRVASARRAHCVEADAGDCARRRREDLSSVDELRASISATLRTPEARVILNYHMTTLGQPPFGGHLSPIGAYHEASDTVLVCDTWQATEPVWAPLDAVWRAATGTDGESGQPRGILLLKMCRAERSRVCV